MKIKKIVCGKFHNNININIDRSNATKKIRIGSKNPNSFKYKEFEPIATDGKVILHNDKIYSVRLFLSVTNKKILNQLIVLTIKEKKIDFRRVGRFRFENKCF